MFAYTKHVLHSYLAELAAIDLMQFNRFILTKIGVKCLQFNTILPIMVAMGVVAFSLAMQDGYYIFIPQSSITAFASYVIFACITSLLVLVLYPLAIIILLNYIGYKIQAPLKKLFFPIKIFVLILAFYLCVTIMTSVNFSIVARIYVTCLWIFLYFVLINIYITYIKHNNGHVAI